VAESNEYKEDHECEAAEEEGETDSVVGAAITWRRRRRRWGVVVSLLRAVLTLLSTHAALTFQLGFRGVILILRPELAEDEPRHRGEEHEATSHDPRHHTETFEILRVGVLVVGCVCGRVWLCVERDFW
jgi:hypothetical protein